MTELFYNQIGVQENTICVLTDSSGLFCADSMSSKIITIQFFDLLLMILVPVLFLVMFLSIFKKRK